MPDDMAAVIDTLPRFLDVKQTAEYLNLNEKKIYALVSEGLIPRHHGHRKADLPA